MRKIWDRVSRTWCDNFHPAPTWPIHGRSRCRKCSRVILVPWANSEAWVALPERHSRETPAPLVVRRFVQSDV